MNKKLTIAIVAILTFTLILSGCAVLPQSVEAAADEISATFVMDVPLETSRQILLEHVMAVKGVAQRPAEIGAAQRIVARVIDATPTHAGTT